VEFPPARGRLGILRKYAKVFRGTADVNIYHLGDDKSLSENSPALPNFEFAFCNTTLGTVATLVKVLNL
jgi:hypothetical protein